MTYNLSIPGQVSEHQLKAIEAVATLVPEGGKVVEVGSLFGCSSWAWAKSVDPSVTVYCIDPWEKNEGVRTMEARLGITYGLEQFKIYTADCPNIRPLQGYSPVQFQDWTDPIDLYYEDAVHTNPILARNLAFWSEKIKPGGILCGDDYRPRFPDVVNGAQDLAERFSRELIRVDFFWCLLPDEALLPGATAIAGQLRALGTEHEALKRGRGAVFYIGPKKPLARAAPGTSPIAECRVSNESLDPWPQTAGGPIAAGLRITPQAAPDKVVAEMRVALPISRLAPDLPVDFDMVLPLAPLPEGQYRLIFDLVGPDGRWTIHPAAESASAPIITVAEGAPGMAITIPGQQEAAQPVLDRRAPLIDRNVTIRDFTSVAFADSHGAFDRHLGAGLLYYALSYVVRSQVSVCIGSGGGFVPSLMRRAQLDAGIMPSITYLVDANLPDLAFGSPLHAGGWLTSENAFLNREQDIVVLPMLSVDAAQLIARNGIRIDHLHIDGDHSVRGVLADFEAFSPLLSPSAVITMHDLRMPGVNEALETILKTRTDLQFLSFRDIGNGTGIVRRQLDASVPRRRQTLADLADPERKVTIQPESGAAAVGESQHRASFERWSYLKTPPYQVRYRLASDWVDRAGDAVVEIGGFPNSVVHHLSKIRAVHLIEPYTTPEFESEVRQAAQERDFPVFLHRTAIGREALDIEALKPFNLVALGLDLSSACKTVLDFEQGLVSLLGLICGASRSVIEIPRFRLSQLLCDHIFRILQPTISQDITLDLSQDPVAFSYHVKDERAVRRVLLIKETRAIDLGASDVRALITLAAGELFDATAKQTQPVEATYKLGAPIEFVLGGNSEPYKRGGWVGAEKRHTWMQGRESWLVVAPVGLDQLSEHSGLDLVLTVKPFVVPGKVDSQRLTVFIKGVELLSTTLREEGSVRCHIPIALAREETPMRICFVHPDAARPCDVLADSKDKKPLALAVREMTLNPSCSAAR